MFDNMDVVVSYVNKHSAALGFTAEYATLADYFAATTNRSGGARTPEEHGNFAPYAIYPGTPPLDLDVAGSPKPPRSSTVISNHARRPTIDPASVSAVEFVFLVSKIVSLN